jgi:hypothetical protein
MQTPPLDPDVADVAPTDSALTSYDEQHVVTYARLLQAESEGADWRDAILRVGAMEHRLAERAANYRRQLRGGVAV